MASTPVTRREDMRRSRATDGPTSFGRSQPRPHSAMRPRCANAVRNSDFSVPTRRSQHRLNGNAIPATAPLMAAMIGFGVVIRNGKRPSKSPLESAAASPSATADPASLLDSSPDEILERSFMSAPAQNARPAPVMMMPTTAGSALARATASRISRSMRLVQAFIASGRFNVIVATGSSTS